MHGLELRGLDVNRGRFHDPRRFGRMFPHLRSLTEFEPGPDQLGRPGGPMDGGTTPDDNPSLTAGFTFLGQFLDHDITFDPTSSLERQNDPNAVENFRTAAFELDSVYGAGPAAQPYLYDPQKPGAFLIGKGDGGHDDLPRASGGQEGGFGFTAIIGDPRNDENLIISQLHLAFLKFHNAVLASKEVQALPPARRFEEAQRIVRWHYQWIILHEFLPKTCGQDVVGDVLKGGRRFFHFDSEPFIPVEFSVAAYRFGHSQVRPSYGIRQGVGAAIFPGSPGAPPGQPPRDLRGNRRLPSDLVIDWTRFFGSNAQKGMRINTKLAAPLLNLPETVIPSRPQIDPVTKQPILKVENRGIDTAERSLAVRNLKRGITFSLPSGQAVAKYMASVGIEPLSEEEIWEGVDGGKGPAPLWFYILREAEHKRRGNGERLHGIGARIVAEVFIGLLEGDRASFVNHEPKWRPTLGSGGKFSMTDLLDIAAGGVTAGGT